MVIIFCFSCEYVFFINIRIIGFVRVVFGGFGGRGGSGGRIGLGLVVLLLLL